MGSLGLRGLAGKAEHLVNKKLGPFNATLVMIWVIVLVLLFRPRIHGFDTVAYYSWLRSVVIQGSLDVTDEFAHYGYLGERGLSPTGYRLNEWPVGSAILWLPFFLAAHLLSLLGRASGLPVSADGYSQVYMVATALGSAVYALIALNWLYELMRDYAGKVEALLAAITSWLASPLVFYMSAHPFMSHANDFFVNTFFFRRWAADSGRPWRSRFSLGLLGGLAVCVRLQNAPLLLWPVAEDALRALRGASPDKADFLKRLIALGAGFILGFLPQMLVWWVVFGQVVVLNPYGTTGAGSFNWTSPHFFDVLFSTNRGLFLWTPMALFGVWGLIRHLPRYRARWAFFLTANFLAQVYVIGSWSSWSGAAAFGQRFLVNSIPGFALGLGALYTAWRRKAGNRAPLFATGALTAWNFVLLARYGLQDVPRMGPVPLKHLLLGQFTFVFKLSKLAPELLKGLLRSLPKPTD